MPCVIIPAPSFLPPEFLKPQAHKNEREFESMDVYHKLVKYKLTPAKSKPRDLGISIVENRTLEFRIDGKKTRIDVPEYIYKIIVHALKDKYYSNFMKIKLCYDKSHIWMKLYLSRTEIDRICAASGVAPDILYQLIKNKLAHVRREHPNYVIDEIKPYENTNVPLTGNYTHYLKIEPYNYQHNNIHWLLQVENNVELGTFALDYIQMDDLFQFQSKHFKLYMEADSHVLYDQNSIWDCKFRKKNFKMYGGVLCDEVGLGKTLSMVSLIIADKFRHSIPAKKKPPVTRPKVVPSKAAKIMVKIKPSSESSHEDDKPRPKITPKIRPKVTVKPKTKETEPTVTELELPTKVETKKEPMDESSLISVNATLVICPRRLVSQWVTEIQKYTNHLKVIEISTLTHVKKYAVAGIRGVDVVVASFSLLDNKNYLKYTEFKLDHYNWRRVIVDEGHEVLLHNLKKRAADTRISTGIFEIQSRYRWVCTGTPLSDTEASFQAITSYLGKLQHNEISPMLYSMDMDLYNKLLEMVFHLNTKESIKKQISIPGKQDHVEFLEFTPTERAVYDNVPYEDDTRRLQVCTSLAISSKDSEIMGGQILSMSQVNKAMSSHYVSTCERLENEIEVIKKKRESMVEKHTSAVAELESELKDLLKQKPLPAEDIDETKREIARLKNNHRAKMKTKERQIESHLKEIASAQKQVQMFKSLDIKHIKRSKCPITGQSLSSGLVAITGDGYYFSKDAIDILSLDGEKEHITCPYTRKQLPREGLLYMNPNKKTKSEDDDMERSKWGTKMSHVINCLRQLFSEDDTARVIIFSQWMQMLILMSKALRDCKINYVFCKGNVHMMSKSIRTFKTDPLVKIILLSSDSCSSGSNLTEASHVFLLDAVGGDMETAQAVEEQAVGRALRLGQTKMVHVHRFIIKDTIEEMYYKRTFQ